MRMSFIDIRLGRQNPADSLTFRRLALIGRGSLALVLIVAAMANVLTVLVARPPQQTLLLEHLIDLDQFSWGRPGALILALLLLLVARALVRGKRHAWWLAVDLCLFSLVSAMLSREEASYTPFAFGLLIALLLLAPLFPTRSDPRSLRRGYAALALGVTCLVIHSLLHQFWPHGLASQVWHFPYQPVFLLTVALRALLFLFLGYGVIEVLRPVLRARQLQRADILRAQEVVEQYGTRSMAHFTLLGADKSYFWSSTRRSFLAYHLAHGVALILGDPIGPAEELEPLLLAFLVYCKRQDWQFALYQASPVIQQICRRWGLHSYKVGEEAIVPVSCFTTKGKVGAPVRHSVTRARRDGLMVRCWQGEPLPQPVYLGMRRITAAWMAQHHTQMQMGFSMGRFPADWSQKLLTAVAFDAHGEAQAFVTWTPLYAGNGWSLDNMRRLADTTPGTMEMLIATSIEWAQARGYATMSLGLAPLAGLESGLERDLRGMTDVETTGGQQPIVESRSWLERSAAFLHQHKLLLGNYTSLHFFKNKFNPVWEPRYLIVRDTRALPRVLAALAQAHGYTWRAILRESGLPGLFRLRPTKAEQTPSRASQPNANEPTSAEHGGVEAPAIALQPAPTAAVLEPAKVR